MPKKELKIHESKCLVTVITSSLCNFSDVEVKVYCSLIYITFIVHGQHIEESLTPNLYIMYIYIYIYVYLYCIFILYKYTYIYICIFIQYTNFECLLFKCQIYINNSRRHFFIKSVIFRNLRIFNRLLQTKSVKEYITE